MPIPSEYVSRGVRIPRTEGVFHFHRRRDGHGDGCVVQTYKIEGKSEKDVITFDCMGVDHAECIVDDTIEEQAILLAQARTEFGF
tara:strand:+ start:765 stop:1019 length:255 start_codon:yes stop_codon:yes gene_type:complete